MSTTAIDEANAGLSGVTASAQMGQAATMHSLSAGMIVHRVGDVSYDLISESTSFALDIAGFMNHRLSPDAATFVYAEKFGQVGRLHWLVHLRHPGDYGRMLDMVDHDAEFQEIYQGDRLPARGGGNWERMFLQGSFQERVMLPQHGYGNESLDELDERSFVPPARHQTSLEASALIDSSSAEWMVIRSAQARYECRDLARFYWYEWQTRVNEALAGEATVSLFEEVWGRQDRLHHMIHLRSADGFNALADLERTDPDLRAIMSRQRVEIGGEAYGWGGLFESGTMTETVLVPVPPKPTPPANGS